MRLAIYGKGGIGKSTVSSNLSAALSSKGRRVLQIGCDPKHDSTRLLLGGRRPRTVLEYLRETEPAHRKLDDVLEIGVNGTMCVEAGGPEPGVGCAGRGIITTFDLLDELGISDLGPELTIYDVLGDVVCGGFAVPLRREHADMVLIVTSGEYMSIYAANNILRGIRNYDGERRRVGGLIMNSSRNETERERVMRFAETVELPIIAALPRSDLFLEAEEMGGTMVDLFPDSGIAGEFISLAERIIEGMNLNQALPLDDGELESVVLGGRRTSTRSEKEVTSKPSIERSVGQRRRYLSRNVRDKEPLYGCAFAGAMSCTLQIDGSVTVAHGPRGCTDIGTQSMMASARRTLAREGRLNIGQAFPRVIATDMTEESMVFGGLEPLERGLERAAEEQDVLFLITTCPEGIIGDDIDQVMANVEQEYTGISIIPIETWGNISGDYVQGVINASIQGAGSLIDPCVEPEGKLVNLVGEKTIATNTDRNFDEVVSMLDNIGVEVNCRFVARTSVERIRNLRRASLNLMSNNDHFTQVLREFLEVEHDQVFLDTPLPVGPEQTELWLRQIGSFFSQEEETERKIDGLSQRYQSGVKEIRPSLEGKRLMIFTWNHDVDWLIELSMDMGMDLAKVCVFNKPDHGRDRDAITRYGERVDFEMGYARERRHDDIVENEPDLVLANYVPSGMPESAHYDTLPFCPDVGYLTGLEVAERWRRMLLLPNREGWRRDEDVQLDPR
jgi:nitrogenase iron protein